MRDWKAVVRAHLEPLALDAARAADVVEELAQHVADHHAELTASGMADEEALLRALAPLRSHPLVAEEISGADRPRIGITATDPATLAAAALILFAVALLAHGVPLARAVGIDPSVALRQE